MAAWLTCPNCDTWDRNEAIENDNDSRITVYQCPKCKVPHIHHWPVYPIGT